MSGSPWLRKRKKRANVLLPALCLALLCLQGVQTLLPKSRIACTVGSFQWLAQGTFPHPEAAYGLIKAHRALIPVLILCQHCRILRFSKGKIDTFTEGSVRIDNFSNT